MTQPPLIVHLTYVLTCGGLETLMVDCINRMPPGKYRHAIVCLTKYDSFIERITQPGVEVFALHKPPGLGLSTHLEFWKLLRRLRPAIVHTYNLAGAEYAFTAALAGVPIRVHAEHGRDASDPEGKNPKHNFLRRCLVPFIDRFIPVSDDLHRWLEQVVGIPPAKTLFIKNGVDTDKFARYKAGNNASPWQESDFVIGTVARVQDIKNHRGLVDAFIRLRQLLPQHSDRLKLSIIGNGPLLPAIQARVAAAGIADAVWLPGARDDIADILHSFTVFALPSLAEGTPVSMLEAMACGLPVVASDVGGIPEVVTDGENGTLVPAGDTEMLAVALARYVEQPSLVQRHGAAARERIEGKFSMASMLASYTTLYDMLCRQKLGKRLPQ